tara:strand:- start:818 stop:1960 length:1143 start_codon:yes stop_codon:yes gene_type:complete
MIDTLKLRSPAISEETAALVESLLVHRQATDMATGEELYSLCSGSLPGSSSSSVSVNVRRQELVWLPPVKAASGCTSLVPCEPYLVVEGSVHKAMLGHNVYGGPERLPQAVAWFVADLESPERLGVSLPPWDEWRIERVDVAEVYDFGNFEGVAQFLHGLGLARYPRRQPHRYGDECVLFAGTTTTLKYYHKGPEFAKHSHKAYAKVMGARAAEELQALANNYLRVELTIKSKKLKTQYGDNPTAGQAKLNDLEALQDLESARVLKEGQKDMDTVRSTEEVRARLREVYEDRLAKTLFGTWLELAALGEDAVRRTMPRRSYYRHRTQLAEAGIAWDSTDVYIRDMSCIPAGFRPVRSDPRRLAGEAVQVKEQLLPYSAVG